MIHLQFPLPAQSVEHWQEIVPFLRPAIEFANGELNEADVLDKVENGDLIICAVYDDLVLIAAVVFELIIFSSGKKVINIQLAGGNRLDEWFNQVSETACILAKEKGCDDVYVIGRPGWQRKLKQLGYETVHTILHKEVL